MATLTLAICPKQHTLGLYLAIKAKTIDIKLRPYTIYKVILENDTCEHEI